MSSNIETRTFSRKLEVRNVKKNGYLEQGLQGYAAVYGVESRDMGGWKEVLVRGAFKQSLGKKLDVRLLFQHRSDSVLARETAGNLILREDNEGLYFEADLIDTQFNRDVVANVRSRNLDAMSFGMPYDSVKTKWDRSADGKTAIRNVIQADVVEISVVTWPAYEETTVQARSERAMREFNNFMQQDAAGKAVSTGILRARHGLSLNKYRY